jgi:hypothetical protein
MTSTFPPYGHSAKLLASVKLPHAGIATYDGRQSSNKSLSLVEDLSIDKTLSLVDSPSTCFVFQGRIDYLSLKVVIGKAGISICQSVSQWKVTPHCKVYKLNFRTTQNSISNLEYICLLVANLILFRWICSCFVVSL